MILRSASALFGLALLGVAAPAQDLVAVAPHAAKVEYEDARVRVVRLRLAPNEQLPMHDRPARVVISLTPNDVRTTRADGTTTNVRTTAGSVAWSEPAKRSVTNLATPLENIIVEFKQTSGKTKPLTGPPSPAPAGYLSDRFHRWVFENQYVRVYDVRVPHGATTDPHTHAYDTIFVQISAGLMASQPKGKAWQKAEPSAAGTVEFSADSKQSRTHRARNEGAGEYHLIMVQLLP